jgi:cytochrome c556
MMSSNRFPQTKRLAVLLALAAVGAGCSPSEPPAAATPAETPASVPAVVATPADFDTSISIAEIMDAVIMRQTDVIWGAVTFDDPPSGPDTDEGWKAVRDATLTMAEAANSLMIPGRHSAPEGKVAGEGELSPAEIDALIERNRPAWNAFALAMYANAMDTVEAIDRRDASAMLDLGGTLDEVCQGCHQTFWYPSQ